MLLDRFPKAKAISTRAVVNDMAEMVKPEMLENYWNKLFPGQIPDRLTFPQVMVNNSFDLEGYTIQVIETGFTDTHNSTSIYVPSIGLLVAGDVVYNEIHPFMAETTKQTRQEWITALDKLESLHPKSAVAGHKNPDNSDSPDNITATKKYLEDFEQLNNETSSAKELFDKMFALYPQRANPGSLWGAATNVKQGFKANTQR
jgi:glyoxylase-like metal-dependent hydrolase (beta-lactamase superfamily II)